MKHKAVWILISALVMVGIGGLVAFWPFGNRHALRLPGVVEIQEVRLGSKVGGRVESVLIEEGKIVEKNQVLIVFEAPELKNQRDQAKARLESAIAEYERAEYGPRDEDKAAAEAAMESAKARYDRMEFGWRIEEKKQAESDLESAKADFEQALKEWNRIVPLYRQQAVSRGEYDAALATYERSRGRRDSLQARYEMMLAGNRKEDKAEAKAEWLKAKAQFELLRNGTRKEDKEIARAKVNELKAIVDSIDINLAETSVRVPPNLGKAVVEVVAVRPGDLVPANQPVVRVLRAEDLWVKVYVPETQYGLVTLNKKVSVTIDSHPGKVLEGVVVQRSNIAEFTPRNVQSVDERRHQVFGVKILVADPDGVLNAGMAAEVTIPQN